MQVFVTGGSGFVGTGVVRELIGAGHRVTGLARSDTSAAKLEAAGATVIRGELTDLDTLASASAAADAVIHMGFIHDFSNFLHSVQVDREAILTIGEALAGSGKPLLVTSGLALKRSGALLTEADEADTAHVPRISEATALGLVDRGVRAGVMRLPPSVHGDGDHGFVAALIGIARDKGAAGYVGEGTNRWAAVHRDDAARAYLLALEKGTAGGRYHAIGDEGIPFRDIATIIGRKLGVPAVSVPAEKADAHFGWMARFATFNVPASSAMTREALGWAPTRQGLIADLEDGTYFDG